MFIKIYLKKTFNNIKNIYKINIFFIYIKN